MHTYLALRNEICAHWDLFRNAIEAHLLLSWNSQKLFVFSVRNVRCLLRPSSSYAVDRDQFTIRPLLRWYYYVFSGDGFIPGVVYIRGVMLFASSAMVDYRRNALLTHSNGCVADALP